jgi:hypothetical protein
MPHSIRTSPSLRWVYALSSSYANASDSFWAMAQSQEINWRKGFSSPFVAVPVTIHLCLCTSQGRSVITDESYCKWMWGVNDCACKTWVTSSDLRFKKSNLMWRRQRCVLVSWVRAFYEIAAGCNIFGNNISGRRPHFQADRKWRVKVKVQCQRNIAFYSFAF